MIKFDFHNPYVRKMAQEYQIPIQNGKLTEQQQKYFQAVLSINSINYYLGKISMAFIKNTLEELYSKKQAWLSDDLLREYIGYFHYPETAQMMPLLMDMNLTHGNLSIVKASLEEIEKEYKNHQEEMTFVLGNTVNKQLKRMTKIDNFSDFSSCLIGAKNYYHLKDQGIESYLYPYQDKKMSAKELTFIIKK